MSSDGDGDDNIPSHWPTFEEVGGVRWDWDELSILSDSDDEDATALPSSSSSQSQRRIARTRSRQQHTSTQRRRRQNSGQSCIFFIIAIYNIIFYVKFFHLDRNSPHLELTVKLPKSSPSLSTSNTSKGICGQLDHITQLIILTIRTMIKTI